MIRFIAFLVASLACISVAGADHRHTSPGVTMERCSDVDIDELQEAIAIEYQGQDDHRTMVTVVCSDSIATVRVLGPSHPRGRIVDVNIAGVDPVVLPRMIALMAVEMWTAPEAEAVSIAESPVAQDEAEGALPEGPRYRRRLMLGAGVTSLHRSVHAGRPMGSVGATGSFAALSLRADWPIRSWIGVFANYSLSTYVQLNGLESLDQSVRWARSEYGLYVPLVKRRYRINAQYSAGRDNYKTRESIFIDSDMAILPNYYYDSIGFDLTYLVDEKFTVGGMATLLFMNNSDDDFSSPSGFRWGMGMTYEVRDRLRLDGRVAAASVSENNSRTVRAYSDVMTSLEFGVQYLY